MACGCRHVCYSVYIQTGAACIMGVVVYLHPLTHTAWPPDGDQQLNVLVMVAVIML